MEDSAEEVVRKVNAAFCNGEVEGNPIFEYIKYILLRWFGQIEFEGKSYNSVNELEIDFPSLNKKEVKRVVAEKINQILQPIRDHFSTGTMKQLAETVAQFRVTR
jgi:tyrosyl-tRNA synthetase